MSAIRADSPRPYFNLSINNEQDVGHAVREARREAYLAGFDKANIFKLCTIVAELCRNMLYHAGGGEFVIRHIHSGNRSGIEIEALDHGPGIADISMAMQDHFSTRGTLGIGLPAVKRLSDEMHIESEPGKGTVVKALKWL